MRTLFQIIQQEFQKENDLVLASIVASSGSTPRGAGSRMLVGKKGRVAGTIGGGSVEYRAELMAMLPYFSSIWTIMTLLLWNLQ